ncbi:ATP-dependent RNA helicase HrpA [Spongiibacter sp.]|uniref:ATP-dependent RNA helicase HrpA n=1 Tax=Spongiibacter sp. TaxID=2024860 RepID=UPI0035678146
MSATDWKELRALLGQCYMPEQFRLRRRLQQLQGRQQGGEDVAAAAEQLSRDLAASVALLQRRRAAVPALHFPEQLPVSQRLEDIRRAIDSHQVVVVAGETGSGKTTQLPKLCLQMGRGINGMIAHTQPRRLAARTVAQRIADELASPLGEAVGYQVRFQEQTSAGSYIKLMTDGILLAAISHDRFLSHYDTIIIDEAHEHSLNIDFLLGYLKTLLPKRPDLKLIITSATIDVERFSRHFDNAPVVEVSGRSYPVEYRYRPLEELSGEQDLGEAVAAVLRELMAEGAQHRGDTLVFLSGERDIREVAKHLRDAQLPGAEVLPLYARLSAREQQRIFDSGGRRGWRVVLATNVAETSLTVPGIRYVIDAGTARISRYSVRSKVQRLPIEAISQASANQRAGRCGRVAEGIAYRLYSREDYERRPAFTEPEIQRTNLAAVILQMLQLGLGDIRKFPFVDAPDSRLIRDGFSLLSELGAVDGERMTELGRSLARFPVDPRIARLIMAAAEQHCLREMLVIASALSIQDPRERPADKQQAADEQHRRFWQEGSDFLAYVALWEYAEEQRQALSASQWRRLCKKEFLSWTRMREWREVHHQLLLMCRQLQLRLNDEPADYQRLHRALLPGFLGQIANKSEEREYLGARNRKLRIFPGSSLRKKNPKWIVAAELAETSQLFARCVAKIEPEWVLGVNDSLLKRNYAEPHWHAKSGRVMAYEQTLLYGLCLRDRHRVHYGPIDPRVSRQILIRQALVEGRYRGNAGFFQHNQGLRREILDLEDKARRRDILVSDEEIYAFYDERIADGISTARQLESWLKKTGADAQLRMSRAQMMRSEGGVDVAQFPAQLHAGDFQLALSYHFEPGHVDDGVSVSLPLAMLHKVPEGRFDWLVPGLLREKCIALVKALPKAQRKQLVPVPDYVDRALSRLAVGDEPLLPALAARLEQLSEARIDLPAWSAASIDDYYRMNIIVLDDEGKRLASGRDIQALREQLAADVQKSIAEESEAGFERRRYQGWEFGELPSEHRFKQAGATLTAYPCLRDDGQEVELGLAETAEEAALQSERGILRLLLLRLPAQCKTLRATLFKGNAQQLEFAACGQQRKAWLESCLLMAARQAFMAEEAALPRHRDDFDALWESGRGQFVEQAERSAKLLSEILAAYARIRRQLKKLNSLSWIHSINDIQRQLSGLFFEDFIYTVSPPALHHYPRYLAAIEERLAKLDGHYQRDRQCTLVIAPLQEQLDDLLASTPRLWRQSPALREYRWLLEELRVSLFAQRLGTAQSVSEKRLKQLWKALKNDVTIS